MNKTFALVLVAVLAVSALLSIILYLQSQNQQQAAPYTVIGILTYAPGHAITLGVSAISVTPRLSPSPAPITWSERFTEQGDLHNSTVDAFLLVSFKSNFTLPSSIPGFPTGFKSNDPVKLTGEISYDEMRQRYAMNVTSISLHSPIPTENFTNPIKVKK